ncbi:hypothetical protein C8Q75DRAFT_808837 [Abortiporus biennis]|nr:hypothetical protein C8Q75DRAFT_808837 [Abortiporus biennis]
MASPASSDTSSGSSSCSSISSARNPPKTLFVRTPLSNNRRQTKVFPAQKYIAVSAQTVCAGPKREPMISRVTMVDYRGNVLLDTLINPTQAITNYRTELTGLLPVHFNNAPSFHEVQSRVAALLKDKIVIGYALWQFLGGLGLTHPAIDTRDAALFMPFRKTLQSRSSNIIPLATLMQYLMNRSIGVHGDYPDEQARATLDLFRSCEQVWENIIKSGAWPCCLPPSECGHCFT